MKILFSFPFLLIYLLLIVQLCWWRGYRRWGLSVIWILIMGLYLLCTPLMTRVFLQVLGEYPPLRQAERLKEQGYQAIVVLGGGLYRGEEMNGQLQAGGYSLSRLRYAAHLARASQLPVLLSGYEAPAMASTLIQDFGLDVAWLEAASQDTDENARFSARLLAPHAIKKIVLVTDVWHMGRGKLAYEHYGFAVQAAPTDFPFAFFRSAPALLMPSATLFPMNLFGLSECFGQIKYRLRYAWLDAVR